MWCGDVSDAARKYGLKFGVYLSPWDRHEPRYKAIPPSMTNTIIAELSELAQHYGDLVEFWLDGAGSAGHVYNFPRIVEDTSHLPAQYAHLRRHRAVRVRRHTLGGQRRWKHSLRKLECDRPAWISALAAG